MNLYNLTLCIQFSFIKNHVDFSNKDMEGLPQDHECLGVNSKCHCQFVQKSTTVYSNFSQFSDLSSIVTKNTDRWRFSTKLYHEVALQFQTSLLQRHLFSNVPISWSEWRPRLESEIGPQASRALAVKKQSIWLVSQFFSCENFFSTQDPDAAGAHWFQRPNQIKK